MPVPQQTMSGDWYQSRPKGWPRHGWEKRLGAILFGALVMFGAETRGVRKLKLGACTAFPYLSEQ